MNRLGLWMMAGAAGVMMTMAGCALFVVGAGAGAGAGAVAYYGNELRASREVTVDRAWDAANTAMKEMEYTIVPAETHKDATGGVVQGRNAKDQVVSIKLMRQTDKITEIHVTVGTFATQDSRNAEQLLFDKMGKHF